MWELLRHDLVMQKKKNKLIFNLLYDKNTKINL
jgi:hypothetical protein